MPSEDRIGPAVQALRAPLDVFRSALAEADEEVRTHRLRAAATEDPGAALAAELGPFAAGKIDPARLEGLLVAAPESAPDLAPIMELAHARFTEALAEADTGFRVEVPSGGDLRDQVRDALGWIGRAFGVSHLVRRARAGGAASAPDGAPDDLHPFHRWNPKERELAPPLVVSVEGADLRCEGLAEFLEGRMKIVLIVSGPTSPAPLARLIAHGLFVAEGNDPDMVRRLAGHPGPGVVAWMEEGAAAHPFVHDPGAGDRTWTRLTVEGGTEALSARIEELERRGRGSPRVAELRHLLDLATAPAEARPEDAGRATTAEDAEDRLATWLLARTDLAEL